MIVHLNGKEVKLTEDVNSVAKLLTHYQLENRIAVVELNKEIVPKEDYETKKVSHNDVVEIIHFVGGG